MYKQLYFYLFNRVTDAVKMLQEGNSGEALQTLVNAQKESEEAFVDFLRMNIKAIANAKKDEAKWPRQLNGEYKEGELIAYLPYSILVTETTSPAMPARARTAQTAVQTAASWFAASRSMR